jgi:hypothetical protein
LNFLAPRSPDALRDSCELTETDTFKHGVYPRNELDPNHPVLDKPDSWLLPYPRLSRQGQSDDSPSIAGSKPPEIARLKHSFWLPRIRVETGTYYSKLIKEDHLGEVLPSPFCV